MTSELNNIERIIEKLDSAYRTLHHFISDSNWDARSVMDKVAKDVSQSLPKQTRTGLLIDESGWEKKGNKSMGMWAKRPIRKSRFMAACAMVKMYR